MAEYFGRLLEDPTQATRMGSVAARGRAAVVASQLERIAQLYEGLARR